MLKKSHESRHFAEICCIQTLKEVSEKPLGFLKWAGWLNNYTFEYVMLGFSQKCRAVTLLVVHVTLGYALIKPSIF